MSKPPLKTPDTQKTSAAKESILRNIKNQKSTPQSVYLLRSTLIVVALIGCLILATLSLTAFIKDILAFFIFDLPPQAILLILPKSLFELLILSLTVTISGYLIFRQTDWPLVRQSGSIIIFGGLLVSLIMSMLVVIAAPKKAEELRNSSQELPLLRDRKKPRQELLDKFQKERPIRGKVLEIREIEDGYQYTIKTRFGQAICLSKEKVNGLDVGDSVKPRNNQILENCRKQD
jgi:hypothetical protein